MSVVEETAIMQTARYVAGHAVVRAVLGYPFRLATVERWQVEAGLTVVGWVEAAGDET